MSTIASGQICGLSRPTALEFSFLLSIPTMLAATGYDLLKELHGSKAAAAAGEAAAHVVMNGQRWIVLAIGFVISFIVAFGVVEWFLAWVRKHGFAVFADLPHHCGNDPADLGEQVARSPIGILGQRRGGRQRGSSRLLLPGSARAERIMKAALGFVRSGLTVTHSARSTPETSLHEGHSDCSFADAQPRPERVSGAGAGAGLDPPFPFPGHLSSDRPIAEYLGGCGAAARSP